MDNAQTQLDDTRHTLSNAAHNFTLLWQSLEDQLTLENRILTKARADNAKSFSSLKSERSEVAEAEKSLAAALASEVSCAHVAADQEVSMKALDSPSGSRFR